jgi:hypothetical protein
MTLQQLRECICCGATNDIQKTTHCINCEQELDEQSIFANYEDEN